MPMKCPECMAILHSEDGQTAYCSPQCGMRYNILFNREWEGREVKPPPPPPPPPVEKKPPEGKMFTQCPHCQKTFTVGLNAAGKTASCPVCSQRFEITKHTPQAKAKCRDHPEVDAEFACAVCGAPICATCAFAQPDGSQKCPTCAANVQRPARAAPPPPLGLNCVNHPEMQAVARCKVCNAPICQTCDFALPGDVHVCPKCVDVQSHSFSPKRKKLMVWSFVLAGVSSLLFVVFFALLLSTSSASEAEAIGMVVGTAILASSLAGTGLGFSALEKHLTNPVGLWVAVIWNLVLAGCLILLSIIGTFMG